MKKLLAGLFIFGALTIAFQAHAFTLDDLMLQIQNLSNEITQLKLSIKASALNPSITTTPTTDLTPRISYYSGKVNQHVDIASGTWQTDVDGSSGSGIDKLTYCKKWYPNTTSVADYQIETINSWHNGGNTGNFTSTRMSYQCVINIITPPIITPINGGWSAWADYGTCVNGLKPQIRSCNNPSPASGGANCVGDIGRQVSCNVTPTSTPIYIPIPTPTYVNISTSVGPNGIISPIGPVSIASGIGATQKFTITPSAGYTPFVTGCGGSLSGNVYTTATIVNQCTITATFKPTPPIITPINGDWSAWSNSGNCMNGYQTQTRSCTNPSPANGGSNCSGLSTQQISCNIPVVSSSCNKKDFTAALIFVAKEDTTSSDLAVYKEKLDYIKNRFPWAFNYATGGLATISIPENPIILDSVGLIGSDGRVDVQSTMKKFYKSSKDNFDFVYIFTNAGNTTGSNYHFNTKNYINGIGFGGIFDNSSNYGSNGKLMGINYIDNLLDTNKFKSCYKEQKNNFSSLTVNSECGMWTILHETAHQWAVYAGDIVDDDNPSKVNLGIRNSGSHYYYGLTSPDGTRNLMGGTTWKKAPNSSVFVNYDLNTDILKYHPFTLYFMGLLPENQYDTKFNLLQNNINYQLTPSQGLMAMESVYKQVSVRDIIKEEGSRTCEEVVPTVPPIPTNNCSQTPFPGSGIFGIGWITTGAEIENLQSYLSNAGYLSASEIDGIFGASTKLAVITFQKANGLNPDGVVGPLTRAKLNERWQTKCLGN